MNEADEKQESLAPEVLSLLQAAHNDVQQSGIAYAKLQGYISQLYGLSEKDKVDLTTGVINREVKQ